MQKEVGLLLAGMTCFDLGIMVLPTHAEVSLNFSKVQTLSANQSYIKYMPGDLASFQTSCTANKGKLVEFQGTKYCQTPKAKGATSTQPK